MKEVSGKVTGKGFEGFVLQVDELYTEVKEAISKVCGDEDIQSRQTGPSETLHDSHSGSVDRSE